ncbi:hypothetical protein ACU686_08405 [Yinghuangia aomiensis]
MTHHRETGAVRFGLAPGTATGRPPSKPRSTPRTPPWWRRSTRTPNHPAANSSTPTTVRLRHAHVAGEIALLTVDWARDDPDGPADGDAPIRGTATGVARRAEDGFWRYRVEAPLS